MLNNSKILLGLLIVAGGLAYYVSQSDSNKAIKTQHLMPAWQNNNAAVEAVTEVKIKQGEETIEIKKVGNNWLLNNGFYVNLTPLSELLQSLQSAEIIEAKTANPENFKQLSLADDDLNVAVYQGENLISHFHLGKSSNSGMTFVRKAGEKQSYLVKNLKPVVFNVSNWQLKTLLDIPANEVIGIEFLPSEGESFKVQRNVDDMSLVVVDMPADYQLIDVAQLSSLAAGLSRLMIDDALPVNLTEKTLKQTNHYELMDNSKVTINLYQQEEDYYLTIDGENYTKYQGWMMKLAAYKFNALIKQASDVIEPISTTEPEVKVVE